MLRAVKGKEKVLIIDDQPLNSKILEAQLIPKGFIVNSLIDLPEDYDDYESYNVVFLDQFLNGYSGDEYIKEMKKYNPEIVVISYTSGVSTLKDVVHYINMGYDDVILKPINEIYLNNILESFGLAKRRLPEVCQRYLAK